MSKCTGQLLQKCMDEAKIWRDDRRDKPERRRARRRFDRALAALGANALERLQVHLYAVAAADASLRT